MIKEIRIDDRLIHGQVALTWPKALDISRILVANDSASVDKTQQMVLKMAAPDHIKVLIRSIDETIDLFNNTEIRNVDLMIIMSNIMDAEKLVEKHHDIISRVNIANTGRFDGGNPAEKEKITENITLSKSELESLNRLVERDTVNIVHQIVPTDKPQEIKKLLN